MFDAAQAGSPVGTGECRSKVVDGRKLLNIPAAMQRCGLSRVAFDQRQKNGWPGLQYKKLKVYKVAFKGARTEAMVAEDELDKAMQLANGWLDQHTYVAGNTRYLPIHYAPRVFTKLCAADIITAVTKGSVLLKGFGRIDAITVPPPTPRNRSEIIVVSEDHLREMNRASNRGSSKRQAAARSVDALPRRPTLLTPAERADRHSERRKPYRDHDGKVWMRAGQLEKKLNVGTGFCERWARTTSRLRAPRKALEFLSRPVGPNCSARFYSLDDATKISEGQETAHPGTGQGKNSVALRNRRLEAAVQFIKSLLLKHGPMPSEKALEACEKMEPALRKPLLTWAKRKAGVLSCPSDWRGTRYWYLKCHAPSLKKQFLAAREQTVIAILTGGPLGNRELRAQAKKQYVGGSFITILQRERKLIERVPGEGRRARWTLTDRARSIAVKKVENGRPALGLLQVVRLEADHIIAAKFTGPTKAAVDYKKRKRPKKGRHGRAPDPDRDRRIWETVQSQQYPTHAAIGRLPENRKNGKPITSSAVSKACKRHLETMEGRSVANEAD